MLAPMRFRPVRHPAAILGACLVAALLPLGKASAQTTPQIRLELVAQPVWHEAGDPLGLRLRVVNEGPGELQGFDLVVAAFRKVRTRSDMRTIFGAGSLTQIASSQLPLPISSDRVLGPGESAVIRVRNPVSDLASIDDEGEPGVFPLQVTLRDASAIPQASLITPLLYYPSADTPRLNVIPIITLNERPRRGPGSAFASEEIDGEARFPLEDALMEGGRIRGLIDVLESQSDEFHFGFAPTPRLLEEIADLADGFDRLADGEVQKVGQSDPVPRAAAGLLERLRDLVVSPGVQNMLVPYSAPDLPTIATEFEAIDTQLRVGEQVVEEVLDIPQSGWVYPTSARIDEITFEQLSDREASLVFSSDSLDAPSNPELAGCPVEAASFLCPVEVRTEQTASRTGFVLDTNLQQSLGQVARPGNDRLDLQQFFAETAMIREEWPGRPDRVLAFAVPQNWSPRPRITRILVNGLANARWLATRTPSEGLQGQDSTERRVRNQLEAPADEPINPSPDIIAGARERVEQFRGVDPPGELVKRLHRDVLVAQSKSWWTEHERGLSYARSAADKVDSEFDKVRIVGPDEITLTSRTGELQFLVVNDTGYPITAGVELVSTQLDLNETEPYEISAEQQRLNVPVTTRSSGIFLLNVQLVTPQGIPIGDAQQIRVRSTDFNAIALGITFGALAFLILFYAVRAVRRKQRSGAEAGTSST